MNDQREAEWMFEVWQDGLKVAAGSGPKEATIREANHYFMQYAEDGPCKVVVKPMSRKVTT